MVAVITPTNLHTDFDIGGAVPNKISVVQATDTVQGKVALATAANFPQPANNVDAATPAYVQAAIAAIPVVGSAAPSGPAGGDLTGTYPNPQVIAATDTVQGKVALATAANFPQPANNVDAATPAYVQAALAAQPFATVPQLLTPSATSGNIVTDDVLRTAIGTGLDRYIHIARNGPAGLFTSLDGTSSGVTGSVPGGGGGNGVTGVVSGNGAGNGATGVVTGSGSGNGTTGIVSGGGDGHGTIGFVTGSGNGNGATGVVTGNGAGNGAAGIVSGNGAGNGTTGVVSGSGNGNGVAGTVFGSGGGSGVIGTVSGSGNGYGTAGVVSGSGSGNGTMGFVTGSGVGHGAAGNVSGSGNGHGVYGEVGGVSGPPGPAVGTGSAVFAVNGTGGARLAASQAILLGANTTWGFFTNGTSFGAGAWTTSDKRTKRDIVKVEDKAAAWLYENVEFVTYTKLMDASFLEKLGDERRARGKAALEELKEPSEKATKEEIAAHAAAHAAAKADAEFKIDTSDEAMSLGKQAGLIAQDLQALLVTLREKFGVDYTWLVKLSNPANSDSIMTLDYTSLNAILMAGQRALILKR